MILVEVLLVVALVAFALAAASAGARVLRTRRAPTVLRPHAPPVERTYVARRPQLADEVLDGAGQIRGCHVLRDGDTGVLLQVPGRKLGTTPKVDLYVHIELPSDGTLTSYVLTAQAVHPEDEGEVPVALAAFDARLRTYIKRSSGLSVVADPA